MKHHNNIWPIIAGSAVGVVGVAVAATTLKNKKGNTPLEIAGEKIAEVTKDARQRIEEIVSEARVHLPEQGGETLRELNTLIAEAKSRLDQIAAQVKIGMRNLSSRIPPESAED
jgi:Spy/CpxP family protein refolding chaperone